MHRVSRFFALTLALNYLILSQPARSEDRNLPTNPNGNYVKIPKGPLEFGRETPTLYGTIDGLIIDNYKTEKQDNGEVKITMDIYNPIVVSGLVKVTNQDGTLDSSETKRIEARPDAPKNILAGGNKWIEDTARILTGKEGTPFDLFRYSNYDPRIGERKQTIEINLKPGQTLEVTNRDTTSLLFHQATAMYDLVTSVAGLGNESADPNDVKKFLLEFAEDMKREGLVSILKSDESLLAQLSQGKSLVDLVDKSTYQKFLTKLLDFTARNGSNILGDAYTAKFSEGITIALAKVGLGPLGTVQAAIFKGIEVANPIIRLYAGDRLTKQRGIPGLLIANVNGNITYPNNISEVQTSSRSNSDLSLIQGQTTSITQGNASHIGSASYGFKTPNQAVQDEVQSQNIASRGRGESTQQANQYTNGQIVNAPLDIGLTWNQDTKLDLDSHLVTPNNEHVYFSNRGNLNQAPNAFLYRDSIPDPNVNSSGLRGAEQTRITQFQSGEYRFYIYNYSDSKGTSSALAAGPNGLSNSGATVKLYGGGETLTNIPNDPNLFDLSNPNVQRVGNPYPGNSTFNVPTNQPGNTWYVFKLNTKTGILYRVDRLGNSPNSIGVPNVR